MSMAATLGVECGATSSTVVILFSDGSTKTFKLGPANFILLTTDQLQSYFLNLRNAVVEHGVNRVQKLGIGMPGILTDADKQVVRKIVISTWPNMENVWIGNDLETALACLQSGQDTVKFIIICGTGSGCYGTNGMITTKIGGYGHVLGDRGSGYSIGHSGLRAALRDYELNNNSSNLLDSLMAFLKVNTVNDLVTLATTVDFSKADMAAMAPIILESWIAGDLVAAKVINDEIDGLVEDSVCLAKKLILVDTVNIMTGLTGSILTENLAYQSEFILRLRKSLCRFSNLSFSVEILKDTSTGALKMVTRDTHSTGNSESTNPTLGESALRDLILPVSTSLSPTECRNPKSNNLDKMPVPAAIDLWLKEESSFYSRILEQKLVLERIIGRVTKAFQNEGRLFYVGAGTSGRLGILDASECPPTFKTPPHWVQGIIAGGTRAISNSVEGAEDSISDGKTAVEDRKVNSKDIVIGIASSGRTPFVWGALHKAKELGAFTCLLAFNPNMTLKHTPDEVININVGPEILTGSTRLKCGSATKCILNMITTLSMVQYGKCLENLMVDLAPTNQKLKERSLRIVLTIMSSRGGKDSKENVSAEVAQRILMKNNYDIKKTVNELTNSSEFSVFD